MPDTQKINLDELLGELKPVATITINHIEYTFWNPKHLAEGEFLQFIEAQASLFEALKNLAPTDEAASENKLLDLYIEQQRISGRSLPPSKRYLEVLARQPEGTFANLLPVQVNKLFDIVSPLIQEKAEVESEAETEDAEGKAPKEKRTKKEPKTIEPSVTDTLAA